jgi:hypothetical protein
MNLLIRPNVRRRRADSAPNTHAQAALGITLRKILRGRRAAGITALECARVYAAKTTCQFREHGRQQIFTLLNSRCAARFRASNGRTIRTSRATPVSSITRPVARTRRQPFRAESVTYASGIKRHLCHPEKIQRETVAAENVSTLFTEVGDRLFAADPTY